MRNDGIKNYMYFGKSGMLSLEFSQTKVKRRGISLVISMMCVAVSPGNTSGAAHEAGTPH